MVSADESEDSADPYRNSTGILPFLSSPLPFSLSSSFIPPEAISMSTDESPEDEYSLITHFFSLGEVLKVRLLFLMTSHSLPPLPLFFRSL